MTSGDRNKQHLIPSGHGKKRNWDGGAGAAVLRPPDQRRHTPSMSDGLGQDANIYYSGSLWSPSGRALFGKLGARYVRLAGRHHSSCARMARAWTAHVCHVGPRCGWDAHLPLCWARVTFLKSPDPCGPLSQTRPLSALRLRRYFASPGRRAKLLRATCAAQDDGCAEATKFEVLL